MLITISEPLRPYSQQAGVRIPLPGTFFEVEIFPALLRVYTLEKSFPKLLKEIQLSIQGIVKKFTAMLDLEKGKIIVRGESKQGYFSYTISHSKDSGKVIVTFDKGEKVLECGGSAAAFISQDFSRSHLSLGNHKAQDWDLVCRRMNMIEILSQWHRLGQLYKVDSKHYCGTANYLTEIKNCIEKREKNRVLDLFEELFLTGFVGLLSPRLQDEKQHGLTLEKVKEGGELTPLILLSEGARLIESLFLQCEKNQIALLPCLPPQFHCGRFVNIACGDFGSIDIEWSKKTLRRMILRSKSDATLNFLFPPELKSFRFLKSKQDRGMRLWTNSPLEIKADFQYFFDNFEK